MGTVVVGMLLLVAVGFAIHSMVNDKKHGKSLQCGCDCSKCSKNVRY